MKFQISSQYGVLELVRKGAHNGIDIAMPQGTELHTFVGGIVTKSLHFGKGKIGNEVVVQDDHGVSHIYGHMSKVNVMEGQHVDKGDLIGYSGNTGNSTAPHLHYGEYANGHYIDPSNHIDKVVNMSGDIGHGMIGFFEDKIMDFLLALQDITLQLIDSIALLGGGICLILYVAGLEKGKHYVWVLFVARILIKFLLGGYLT